MSIHLNNTVTGYEPHERAHTEEKWTFCSNNETRSENYSNF